MAVSLANAVLHPHVVAERIRGGVPPVTVLDHTFKALAERSSTMPVVSLLQLVLALLV